MARRRKKSTEPFGSETYWHESQPSAALHSWPHELRADSETVQVHSDCLKAHSIIKPLREKSSCDWKVISQLFLQSGVVCPPLSLQYSCWPPTLRATIPMNASFTKWWFVMISRGRRHLKEFCFVYTICNSSSPAYIQRLLKARELQVQVWIFKIQTISSSLWIMPAVDETALWLIVICHAPPNPSPLFSALSLSLPLPTGRSRERLLQEVNRQI